MIMTVTDSAAEKLGALVQEHGLEGEKGLRLFARGGGCGCSGPSFGMTIDAAAETDQVLHIAGIRFIVDAESSESLEGATVDYIEDVMRSGFTIEAPNAAATAGGGCGCGRA